MRWWLQTDPPCIMSVDNASVKGMDFSELIIDDPDLWMVQWTEGKGEIERQSIIDGSGDGDANLNGLREQFYDITPYVPLFQQFLTRMQAKALLLSQAKKIQIELIQQLFESKRQLPIHYPVAAGDYWWDASDVGPMAVNTSTTAADLVTAVNGVISNVNNIVNYLNANLVPTINANIVVPGNLGVYYHNNQTIYYANIIETAAWNAINAVEFFLNYTLIGSLGTPANTLNYQLQSKALGEPAYSVASPGLGGNMGGIQGTVQPYTIPTLPASTSFANVHALTWTNISQVQLSSVQWIPLGATAPVNLTPAESKGLMDAINNRTKALQSVKTTKIAQVNALTTVPAVINYDVLAGWPVIPVPPGFVLQAPVQKTSSIAIIGTPVTGGGGDGIPEAPNNGVTYGRRNMAWNPALALAGDVLDGGNF